jgi:hypothetical protein
VVSIGVLGDQQPTNRVLVDVDNEFDDGSLVLSHGGGDSVDASDVDIVLEDTTAQRYTLTDCADIGGDDAVLNPRE